MKKVNEKMTVEIPGHKYNIHIKKGVLVDVHKYVDLERKVLIVTDDEIPEEYVSALQQQCPECYLATVHAGEASKCFIYLQFIWNALLDNGFGRKDLLIGLGGGVVGDLTSFAAATYMRGVDYINIPTSTLAQIDSSIGGKGAINLGDVKNIVGAFHQPRAVFIDTDLLQTLDDRNFYNGLAEAVKAGLIGDAELFELFEQLPAEREQIQQEYIEQIIVKALAVKKSVVEQDEKENGLRQILNFGHTIGHAIESAGELAGMLHGEAIGIGMLQVTEDAALRERLAAVLRKLNLPTSHEYPAEQLMEIISHDKKQSGNKINLILVKTPGKAEIVKMPLEAVKKYL
jgi:3-dehydroquinate synthase